VAVVTPRILPGDGDPRHGTRNGYVNLGCRCDLCRAASSVSSLEYKHRTGRAVPMEQHLAAVRAEAEARDNHGTESRYNLGCRCRACRNGAAAARRRRRHAVRASVTR
jgi:hypothetical protein